MDAHAVTESSDIVLEAVQLNAFVDLEHSSLPTLELSDPDPEHALAETRTAHWDGTPEPTPVYEYVSLEAGNEITGPAVIEAPDTTYAVNAGWTFSVDEYGNGVLTKQ